MKKFVSLFLLFFPMLMSAESESVTALKPLTSDQKTIDFEYLYTVLRDNYPFSELPSVNMVWIGLPSMMSMCGG